MIVLADLLAASSAGFQDGNRHHALRNPECGKSDAQDFALGVT
jgi:hypothetical protein